MVKESDSKSKDSWLESSVKAGELYMNTNKTLINENTAKTLKIHSCRFENLPISSSSYENNMLKISHLLLFQIFPREICEPLLLFGICASNICEKFVYKHSKTIEYIKN